ncbi:UNVERIFIED_CONTAM: hypothetical protein FKN15_001673 [Acipenser sinensis]
MLNLQPSVLADFCSVTWKLLQVLCFPLQAYNIHVNGVVHCQVRYSQLLGLHEQLKKEYGNNVVPAFPPKKLFTLTPAEVEQRREQLEKYMQAVRQDPILGASETFNSFLRKAQQETQQIATEEVHLDVYLSNGQKVKVNILTSDQTEDVLEVRQRSVGKLIKWQNVVRKLQEFELPFVSVTSLRNPEYRIVLRKSYWDSAYDNDVMDNRVGLNLLYAQTVSDTERGWILVNKEQHRQLKSLQEKGSKKEFIRLAQTLKYFGYIKFDPCITDFPEKGCHVIVSAGNNELNFHVKLPNDQIKEGSFKVTRMRCWRVTSSQVPVANGTANSGTSGKSDIKLELAFEYLMSKDRLQWVTVTSPQAIMMSICLQSMVDELMVKKSGGSIKKDSPESNREPVVKLSDSPESNREPVVKLSVMTGAKNGMATKMKQDYPYLENAQCIAHRLALVTSQAANNVTYMQKYQEIITSLYYYFKHLTVHVAKLQEMQEVLDAPLLKIKEVYSRCKKNNISGSKQYLTVASGVVMSVFVSPVIAAVTVGVGVPLMVTYVYGVVPMTLCRNGWCGAEKDQAEPGKIHLEDLANFSDHWTGKPYPAVSEASVHEATTLPSTSRSHPDKESNKELDNQSASTVALAGSMFSDTQDPSFWEGNNIEVQVEIEAHPRDGREQSLSSILSSQSLSVESLGCSREQLCGGELNRGATPETINIV